MPDETENTTETTQPDSKPTITIAEKTGSASATDSEPTITIAEKEGEE